MKTLWVLGAYCPRIDAIDRLLREAGKEVGYAAPPDAGECERVEVDTAYQASGALVGWCRDYLLTAQDSGWTAYDKVYLVECGGPGLEVEADNATIQHYGSDQSPGGLFPKSAVGQVISELAQLGDLPVSWELEVRESEECGKIVLEGERWLVDLGMDGDKGPIWAYIPREIVLAAEEGAV